MDRDDRGARAAGRTKTAGESRNAALDLKAGFFQQLAHQASGFDLLHTELGEIEDAVVERGDRLGVAVEVVEAQCLLAAHIGSLRTHGCSPPAVNAMPRVTVSFFNLSSACRNLQQVSLCRISERR